MGRTLAEKVWDEHVVRSVDGEPDLLYIDLHLVHEVTSPQAFDGLRLAGRGVRRPDLTIATEDHNVPTLDWDQPIADPVSRTQVETLRANAFHVIDSTRVISIATNLGDTKSIITHPGTTSHGRLTEVQRQAAGIGQGLIRLAVGLEHIEDIKNDLARGLATLPASPSVSQ